MDQFNYTNKYLLKIAVFLIFIFLTLVTLRSFTQSRNEPDPTPKSNSTQHSDVERVFIKDIEQLNDQVIQSLRDEIERKLYEHASDTQPDLYTGSIRKDSYTKNVRGAVIIVNFLVDVAPEDITYKVNVRTLQNNSTIVVSCALKEQQLIPLATCEDSEYI